MSVKCQLLAHQQVSTWVNVSDIFVPDPDILNALCLNDCSLQGTCTLGKQYQFTKYSEIQTSCLLLVDKEI